MLLLHQLSLMLLRRLTTVCCGPVQDIEAKESERARAEVQAGATGKAAAKLAKDCAKGEAERARHAADMEAMKATFKVPARSSRRVQGSQGPDGDFSGTSSSNSCDQLLSAQSAMTLSIVVAWIRSESGPETRLCQ